MQNLSQYQERMDSAEGLTVLGTESGSGKTVVTTGLTALLIEQGFQAQAIKPVVTGFQADWQAELSFISTITRAPLDYQPTLVEQGIGINANTWHQITATKRNFPGLTLLELPGSAATPLTFDTNGVDNGWLDSCNLAYAFGYPCILVAKHNEQMLEKLSIFSQYIKSKALNLIGLITVEVSAGEGALLEQHLTRTQTELLLLARTQTPYLGCIKFSPSISVPLGKQGNVIKLTSAGLELLGIIKALNLKVPLK